MKNIFENKKTPALLLFTVLSGILLIISWPPRHTGFLLFLSFIPLLYALDQAKNLKQTFLFSLIACLLWALGTMYWEAGVSTLNADSKRFFFILSFLIVALLMTIPFLLWKRLQKYLPAYLRWLSLPLLWTAYEYLNGKGDLAMNWLNLEYGLTYFPGVIRFSQFTGSHGVTFLVMSVNILLYLILKNRKEKKPLKVPVLLLLLILLGVTATDIISGSAVNTVNGKTKKVAIIQPNWNSFYTPDDNAFDHEIDTLEKLTAPLIGQHIDLVVCSEAFIHHQSRSTHAILMDGINLNDSTVQRLRRLSAKLGAPILTGMELAKLYSSDGPPTLTAQFVSRKFYYDTYNAAVLISYDQPVQIYVKNKLCPFTERFPFLGFFSFFNNYNERINKKYISYGTFENPNIITYGDMRIAAAICWESSFPDYVADMVRKNNANMVALVSSNFSLGPVAANIDEAYTIPLAVQLNCPVVRCANTGISCFIDKNGNVSQTSHWDEQKVMVQDVELSSAQTLFVKQGDLVGKYSFILSILLLLFPFTKRIFKKLAGPKEAEKNRQPIRPSKSKK
ncbi:MAG TPA: apolipoprotein N-acyltransferase [Bacteroidia bacterium]|nr:apolipoprotein N-acyltransferase [Bacteroidia bacterium]